MRLLRAVDGSILLPSFTIPFSVRNVTFCSDYRHAPNVVAHEQTRMRLSSAFYLLAFCSMRLLAKASMHNNLNMARIYVMLYAWMPMHCG